MCFTVIYFVNFHKVQAWVRQSLRFKIGIMPKAFLVKKTAVFYYTACKGYFIKISQN